MANDINAVTSLAQNAIASLLESTPILGHIAHNYGDDASGIGQTVNVISYLENTVNETTAKNGSIDYKGLAKGSAVTTSVTLDKILSAGHTFTAYDLENMTDAQRAQALVEDAKALGNHMDKLISGVAFTTANHEEVSAGAADKLTIDDELALRYAALAQGIDPTKLLRVISPVGLNVLLSDAKILASLTSLSEDALRKGQIVEMLGMKYVTSQNIPEGYWGYLMHENAVAVAARPTIAIGAEWSQVMTVEGGFSATAKSIADGNGNAKTDVVEAAFGVAPVKSGTKKRIFVLKKA